MKSQLNWKSSLIIGCCTLVAALAVLGADGLVRTTGALLLVLFLPGYACSLVVEPEFDSQLSMLRLAKAFGFSIVISAIVGVLIQQLPGGLRLRNIVGILCGIVLMLLVSAMIRAARRTSGASQTYRSSHSQDILGIALTIAIVSIAFTGIAWTSTFHKSAQGDSGSLSLALIQVEKSDQTAMLIVDVGNIKSVPQAPKLVASVNGRSKAEVPLAVLKQYTELRLHLTLEGIRPGDRIQIDLNSSGGTTPLRSVHVTL